MTGKQFVAWLSVAFPSETFIVNARVGVYRADGKEYTRSSVEVSLHGYNEEEYHCVSHVAATWDELRDKVEAFLAHRVKLEPLALCDVSEK